MGGGSIGADAGTQVADALARSAIPRGSGARYETRSMLLTVTTTNQPAADLATCSPRLQSSTLCQGPR
jgi:hypothetical protein